MNNQPIDCLLIGHNEMDFPQYEKSVREMGTDSGAYRDLNKNFLVYRGVPYTAPEIFNIFGAPEEPMTMGDTFNLAVGYLGTYLHRRGFTFDFVNTFRGEQDDLAEKLRNPGALTVGIITTLYVSVFPVLEIVEFVRRHAPDTRIIIGGPFVANQVRSLAEEELQYLFETIDADIYVNSHQGESALAEVLGRLKKGTSLDGTANVFYRDGGSPDADYVAGPTERENNRLEENMTDWDLLADRASSFHHLNVRSSVSCPFSCSFCGFPRHAGEYRTVPVEQVEKALQQVNRLPGVTSVQFIDDTFNVPQARFKELLKMMIRNRFKFRWHSHFRCQFADRETVELMKESGCEGVFLGIESGSDRILKIMNKAADTTRYRRGVELLKEQGILTYGSFIIGFPGETDDTLAETVDFIKTSGIDLFRTQLWYCDPLTPIFASAKEYGIRGSHFEWSHNTFDSKRASEVTDEIFLSINDPLWIPQYNFEFEGIFHLLHRGYDRDQAKTFLRAFNKGIKEKITAPPGKEISPKVMEDLEKALGQKEFPTKSTNDDLGTSFDFD